MGLLSFARAPEPSAQVPPAEVVAGPEPAPSTASRVLVPERSVPTMGPFTFAGMVKSCAPSQQTWLGPKAQSLPELDGQSMLDAMDSHCHLDRMASVLHQTWDKTLRSLSCPTEVPVQTPVNLVGAVLVFCDPDQFYRLPLRNIPPRFVTAVGVHPKKVHQVTPAVMEQLSAIIKDRSVDDTYIHSKHSFHWFDIRSTRKHKTIKKR